MSALGSTRYEEEEGRLPPERLTCMTIRAVHLQVLPNLTIDAFINALRRFMSRRGKPQRLFSDNGTNFVGAVTELGAALQEWNNKRKL